MLQVSVLKSYLHMQDACKFMIESISSHTLNNFKMALIFLFENSMKTSSFHKVDLHDVP